MVKKKEGGISLKTKTCKVCGEEIHKNVSVCPHCGAKSMSWMMGDKLVLCKSCRKKIAKSAAVCPYCGKRQHTASLAVVGILGAIAVFCLALAIITIATNSPKPSAPASGDVSQQSSQVTPTAESDDLILEPGTYIVGEDIPAGKYDCVAVDGFGVFRGDVASLAPAGLVQTMGNVSSSIGGETVSVDGNMTYNNLTLADGDIIYVEMSLSVQLNPSE